MRKTEFLFTAVFVWACTATAAYASPPLPRAEYPRPQFERKEWINLNGEWTYKFDVSGSGIERGYPNHKQFDDTIIVPFAPESALSGVACTDFINHIWYHRPIDIPAHWDAKRINLHFGAVYYTAEVYLDGRFVGRHFGGSSSFAFDITRFVTPGQRHDLVVWASSDVRSERQPTGKQSLQYASFSCNYTRTTGIWQTVWMEAVSHAGLERTHVIADPDQERFVIQPEFYAGSDNTWRVTLRDGRRVVAVEEAAAANSSVIVLAVGKAKHWSPESPFLYDLTYEVISPAGEVLDRVESYAGMRKVHIVGNRVYLNNEPYYQRLVLDQGFYPDGIWTAPTDEALRRDIELGIRAGFNGARLHQKVFEERYHYWADKLGYLTWGEFPSWGMDANTIGAARNFIPEWIECVIRDRNHPSLIVWTMMNEQFWPDAVQYPRLANDLYDITKNLDPTRPVNTSSGGTYVKTDLWTIHNYEQDPVELKKQLYDDSVFQQTPILTAECRKNIGFNFLRDNETFDFPLYDGSMPYLVDEFGGIRWIAQTTSAAVPPDTAQQLWGYGVPPATLDEFYTRLEGQVRAVVSLSDQIWGYCYTQLTDVEQERNGIYYYDRSPKFDMNRIHAIFTVRPPDGNDK